MPILQGKEQENGRNDKEDVERHRGRAVNGDGEESGADIEEEVCDEGNQSVWGEE
jgi:hypothetical protein